MAKRLYRSRDDRIVAGVAGGLAEYFGIDPTIVRMLWLLALLPGGVPGLVPYLICWLIIPLKPPSTPEAGAPEAPSRGGDVAEGPTIATNR